MLRKNYLFAAGGFFILGFLGFSLLIHLNRFVFADHDITVRIQDFVPNSLTFPFSLLSLLGSLEISTIILFLAIIFLKGINRISAILLYGLMHLVELFGKAFVQHSGPPFMFFKYDISFYFPSSHVQPGSSYPSGHAGRTAFISAILIIFILNSKKFSTPVRLLLVGIIFIFDAFMFVSRVYLGEHWTTDVIGGALLGAGLGLLSQLQAFGDQRPRPASRASV